LREILFCIPRYGIDSASWVVSISARSEIV
jgi:hypothetical protein